MPSLSVSPRCCCSNWRALFPAQFTTFDFVLLPILGDGGLSMLMGELVTITRYRLPIKVVMKNGTLGQIKWEQMMFLGNPETECDLTPIDFARVAEA